MRSIALYRSVAVPLGFIAYVDHVRHGIEVNWLGAVDASVALWPVTATPMVASRK